MGMSYWRGKLKKNSGSIVYDKADGSGSVDVQMDLSSIDFGLDAMNAWATGKDFFDVANKGSMATFKGRFDGATGGVPARVVGELTLNGKTQPLTLTVHQLKCMPHPLYKRDFCGADASGSFNREDFGLTAGKSYGFKMDVNLRIQVEARRERVARSVNGPGRSTRRRPGRPRRVPVTGRAGRGGCWRGRPPAARRRSGDRRACASG